MSDVIISRRGSSSKGGNRLITEYITYNCNWVVPDGVKDNKFDVIVFGGGGAGWMNNNCGGGSGWMNNGILTLTPGEIIPITIPKLNFANLKSNSSINANKGIGYMNYSPYSGPITGGTSSFGIYLSANGGTGTFGGGNGGSGGGCGSWQGNGGNGYQFGGGSCRNKDNAVGGHGGVWGGGGAGLGKGGNGGIYGGGGGGGSEYSCRGLSDLRGGYGGKYGGGGGSGTRWNKNNWYTNYGIGGEFGGNGGLGSVNNVTINDTYAGVAAENGTNTMGLNNIPEAFRGEGKAGTFIKYATSGSGGGGFGGNGGNGYTNTNTVDRFGGGGGGGYGSNGGDSLGSSYCKAGGGGGGYGGDGSPYGGGGGYGKQSIGLWGGGGYYCPGGGINATIGGGGIGIWKDGVLVASYGSGGMRVSDVQDYYMMHRLPEPGICIIQYYV